MTGKPHKVGRARFLIEGIDAHITVSVWPRSMGEMRAVVDTLGGIDRARVDTDSVLFPPASGGLGVRVFSPHRELITRAMFERRDYSGCRG